MKLVDVIKKPVISEKSMKAAESNNYTFIVDRRASKNQIREAVKTAFGVKVKRVRTMVGKKKRKRLPDQRKALPAPVKKAIIELEKGEKLDIYEG